MSNEAAVQEKTESPEVVTFTPEQYKKIDAVIAKYKDKPGSLIPVLQQAQEVCGFLPHVVQRYVAKGMKMSPSVVFGVATFYSFFTLVPRGRHIIRVCLGTACYVKRSEEILDKIKAELDLEVGEITRDKKYSLEAVRCLGACGLAPVVVLGQDRLKIFSLVFSIRRWTYG